MGHAGFLALAILLGFNTSGAVSQGTAFTYQGRLQQAGTPPTGLYDFQFGLWDSSASGTRSGAVLTATAVGVTNGLFAVSLDFGAVYNGTAFWLEIAARTNGAASYATLAPRQALSSAPFANYSTLAAGASIATLANSVAAGSVTSAGLAPGAVTSSALATGSVSAAALAPGAVSQLGSPGGAFTNAVQVNTNGWVGIGDSTPSAALEVTGGPPVLGLQVYATLMDGLGNGTNLGGVQQMAISGNLIAVAADSDNAVTILNSASGTLTWRANLANGQGNYTNLNRAIGVAISPNNLLAIAAWRSSAVTLVDISNPDSPVWKANLINGQGGFTDLAGATAVAFKTNLLAIASSNANAVTLVDVSNPSAPVQRNVIRSGYYGFNYLGNPNAVAFSGNILAMCSWNSNAVTLADVSNPASPVLKSVIGPSSGFALVNLPWELAFDGSLLAIAAYETDATTLVDISNPSTPVLRCVLQNNSLGITNSVSPQGLAFLHRNNRVWLAIAARDSDRLTVFDVTDAAHPVLRANYKPHLMGLEYLHSPRSLGFNADGLLVVPSENYPSALSLVGLLEAQGGVASDTWMGIGTINPQAALDVVGDVLVENANRLEVHAARLALGSGSAAPGVNATAVGAGDTASGAGATALGYNATASGDYATTLGYTTTAAGKYATALGYNTTASGAGSLAAGAQAQAQHDGAFVWADYNPGSSFASTTTNQFLIRAGNGVGINKNNPTAALDVNGTVAASALSVGGAVTAGQLSVLDITSSFHLDDNDLYLRQNWDNNHGLGWYGASKLFGTMNVDGPVLYGWSGGALATLGNGTNPALYWNNLGVINVDPGNMNTGSVSSASLTFGANSGEGLGSRRSSGLNQYGLDFFTSGARRLSIFNNGWVSLGGVSPEHPLDVSGNVACRASVMVNSKNLADPTYAGLPGLLFGDYSTGEWITSQRTASGPNPNGLDFYTGFNRHLIIDNSGKVGINRQPAANSLEVAGNASKDTAGSWLANSDARIKTNIQPVTGALATLDRVRLVSFEYTDAYRHSHPTVEDRPYLNVVAQEFRDVFPHEVKSSGERLPDGSEILQVDTYPLTIYSAAAVQELNHKFAQEIKTKDAEIQALKQRLDRLEEELHGTKRPPRVVPARE